jgi:hypothetical protein
MIQLPPELSKPHLRNSCSKGDVFLWKQYVGKNEIKDSYFVFLTNCIDDKFITARATSRVDKYNGVKATRLMNDIMFIKKGETPIFSKNTILDLSYTTTFTVNELHKLMGSALIKKGKLSDIIINKIDSAVVTSISLSSKDIKNIISSKRK